MEKEVLEEIWEKLAKLEELGGVPDELDIPTDELNGLTEQKAVELIKELDREIDERIEEEAEAYALEGLEGGGEDGEG
jgi:hypothetical protein